MSDGRPSLRAPIAPGSDLRLGARFGGQALRGALAAAYSGGCAVA